MCHPENCEIIQQSPKSVQIQMMKNKSLQDLIK